MIDVLSRFPVLKTEAEVLQASETRDRLTNNGCDVYIGTAELVPNTESNSTAIVRVCRPTMCVNLETKHVCIATGSRSNRPLEVRPGVPLPFTKGRVICS